MTKHKQGNRCYSGQKSHLENARRRTMIAKGELPEVEYTMNVHEAIKAAGL